MSTIIRDEKTGLRLEVFNEFVDKPKLLYRKFAYNDIQPILDEENWTLVKADEVDTYIDYISKKIKDYDIDADFILLDDCKLYSVKTGKVTDGCSLFKYHALVIFRTIKTKILKG